MKFQSTRVFNFEGAIRGMRNPLNSYHKADSEFGIAENDDQVYDIISDKFYEYHNDKSMEELDELDYSYRDSWEENYANNCFSSAFPQSEHCHEYAAIGPNDMKLAQTLAAAGGEHRKYLRQIFVCVDISAPLYFFKEFDTYKVGTTANSTSTMHTIQKYPITLPKFEIGDYDQTLEMIDDCTIGDKMKFFVDDLEQLRLKYLEYNDKAKQPELIENEKKHYERIAKAYWKELIRWLPNSWIQTRTWTANYEVLRNMYHQRKNHKLVEWHKFCEWVETLPYAHELIIN